MNAVDLLERLAVHFQRERPTQLQVAYLQATDILFHKAWKWCDPKTCDGNPTRRDHIKKFFKRVDLLINRVLGLHSSSSRRITAQLPARTLRLICSDHGHGISRGRIFVNNLLQEWGFLKPQRGLSLLSRNVTLLAMNAARRKTRRKEMALDWKRTKAYLAHVGIYGFVYINLKGRDVHGSVPAEQYENVRNALTEKFLAEKIPGSDEPLFPKVLKGEEVYARKAELNLPDLVIVPADGFFPRKKLTNGPAVKITPHAIGGVHRTDGIYLFEGNGIDASHGLGQRASIADIAPTLLAALGQPVPRSMTGNVLKKIFTSPPDVKYSEAGAEENAPAAEAVYSRDEEQAIEKRLSDLGYLE